MPKKPKKTLRMKLTDDLFLRASKLEDSGNMRAAFRLCLEGAKAGDTSCQVNLGNLYDAGEGVKRDRAAAMYWYKRAYRQGDASAANNIAVMWRNEDRPKRALDWFRKAVELGNEGANLEIAKYYLTEKISPAKARRHLQTVANSERTSEADVEEAQKLLKQLD